MPLALAGFALQSIPLKGSTALSSSLVPFSRVRVLNHLQLPACRQAAC